MNKTQDWCMNSIVCRSWHAVAAKWSLTAEACSPNCRIIIKEDSQWVWLWASTMRVYVYLLTSFSVCLCVCVWLTVSVCVGVCVHVCVFARDKVLALCWSWRIVNLSRSCCKSWGFREFLKGDMWCVCMCASLSACRVLFMSCSIPCEACECSCLSLFFM